MKKCTPLWGEARLEVKRVKNTTCSCSDQFWTLRCRKSARRPGAKHMCGSQKCQSTSGSEHFWTLSCSRSTRFCGVKHIFKWKVLKTATFGRLLEVEMSKKCTPLWREARLEVKMHKTPQLRKLRGRKSAHRCGAKHIWRSKCTKHRMLRALFDHSMATGC